MSIFNAYFVNVHAGVIDYQNNKDFFRRIPVGHQ